eukprot:Gb_33837 [translate_table: standard]
MCAMDYIIEAQKEGEIIEDNVLYIVGNMNVSPSPCAPQAPIAGRDFRVAQLERATDHIMRCVCGVVRAVAEVVSALRNAMENNTNCFQAQWMAVDWRDNQLVSLHVQSSSSPTLRIETFSDPICLEEKLLCPWIPISTVHGELQRRLHGIAVNLVKIEKLRVHFMDDIEFILHNALSTWEGKNILLQECHRASFMTLNMMAKQLLDLSPSKETDEIAKQFYDFSEAVLTLPVKIPGSKYARGIKERRKNPQIAHNDLLTKLLNEETLSDEIVSDFLVFLLFAGHETSSRSTAFSIKFLTECPKALEQLRVVNETLRLGNVAPFVYREAKEDIKVKDYLVPKGSKIMAFISAVHVDDKYYPAALKFDPWRWEGYDQEVSNSPSYTPFGGGARLCSGARLGRLEMALFLHHFVTKFQCRFFLCSDIRA